MSRVSTRRGENAGDERPSSWWAASRLPFGFWLVLGVGALHLAHERRGAPAVTAADRGLAVVLATGGLVLMLLAAWAAGASSGGLMLLAGVHGPLLSWAVSVATGTSRAGRGG